MKLVLTLANHQHPEYYLEKRSIVNIFSDAGYETVWVGNQNFRGNRYNIGHGIIAGECSTAYELAETVETGGGTDQVVLEAMEHLLRDNKKDRIIFIHLRGSHTKYSTRYPDEFEYFNHGSIPLPYGENLPDDDKTIIDEYDNSVRYNDYIVSSIIKLVKARCEYSWVLYFSDHGEELFEYRDLFGHQEKNCSKYMCEIPFILWVSDRYREAGRDMFRRLPEYLERPYSTEDVIHSISELSGLRYADLDTGRSLFSKNFAAKERIVNKIPYKEVPPAK